MRENYVELLSSLNDETINGKSLGCYMIFPNPLNVNKYIGIISYNNRSSISPGKIDMEDEAYISLMNFLGNEYFEITCYGMYDYKIWDISNDNEELLNGYFGHHWNN